MARSVNNVSIPNTKTGVYLVEIVTEKGKVNKKIILKQLENKNKQYEKNKYRFRKYFS